MSLPGSPSGALRGAVDLSSLGRPAPATPAAGRGGSGAPAGAGAAPGGGVLLELTDETFEEAFLATRDVPAIFVLWDSSAAQTRAAVEAMVTAASPYAGRVRVCAMDVREAPRTAAAFQIQQIPASLAIIAGQPVPLFAGMQPAEALGSVIEQVLQAAAQYGVTGTYEVSDGPSAAEPKDDPVARMHATAFDAIESGDYATAIATYEQALKDNPADADAKGGLAQVKLLQRTQDVDLNAVRHAAASDPTDVDAQLLVADVDLLGGHVEDAFARLVDVVRATSEEDRDKARTHLLELFEVVGNQDPRVAKARRALMSALF